MSKSNKRDAWTYLIVALLMINLFVINNYVTTKAIVIIEGKSNTSNHNTFNIETIKNGVTNSYSGIVKRTKGVFGISNDTSKPTGNLNSSTSDNNLSHTSLDVGINTKPILPTRQINGLGDKNAPISVAPITGTKLHKQSVSDINKSKGVML